MDMPVLFVGHGSPTNIIEKNRFTQGWAEIAGRIPRPQAILCVSAHWFGHGQMASTAVQPETIYDFYGFPDELYDIRYPAPGAPELAHRAAELLGGDVKLDPARGLDHGAWSVLHFMYPQADVPVCQLSVDAANTPLASYEAGQRLRALRDEGVFIVGSGNIVHNLRRVAWDNPDGGYPWADEFDDYILQAITAGRHDDVIHYERAGESAKQAVPSRDHYDPLLYVLGAAGESAPVHVFNTERVLGSMSMTCYLLG